MKRAIFLAAAATAILVAPATSEARCVNVPDRGATQYQECKQTKALREPGIELILSFPRGDPDPTFKVYLEWLPKERCRQTDPDWGHWPYCHEEDQCLLYVEVTRLPTLDTGGRPVEDGGIVHLNNAVRHVQGGNWTSQLVAGNTETLRAQDMAVRFDNDVCWAGVHLKYATRLGLFYK